MDLTFSALTMLWLRSRFPSWVDFDGDDEPGDIVVGGLVVAMCFMLLALTMLWLKSVSTFLAICGGGPGRIM